MDREELKNELKKLNIRIDRLILAGKPYSKEASEHKRLTKALNG